MPCCEHEHRTEHQPMRTVDWRWREYTRLYDGTYRSIPDLGLSIAYEPDHYLHLASTGTEPDMVAYTASPDKGIADRQTVIKFGKYLKKYHGEELTDAQIQNAVTLLKTKLTATPATLRFTTDRDTISRIFETETRACGSDAVSCMHGKFEDWTNRPYHVYADSPDVAVAYLEESGQIKARSVVSTKDKVFVRLYSVDGCNVLCEQLRQLLDEAGYEKGSLEGNRLNKLPTRKGKEVLPYIDNGGMGVYESRGHWVVCDPSDDNVEYTCDDTDGTGTPKCSECNEYEDDCSCIWCDCCEERYAHGCDTCSMCEQCNLCTEHGGCQCHRCGECGELIEPRRSYMTACECDRCGECGEVENECECESDDDDDDDTSPEPEPSRLPTGAYFRYQSNSDRTYHTVPVLASVRFAGHIFLVHHDVDYPHLYNVSYGPAGLSAGAGTAYTSIEETITALCNRNPDLVHRVVTSVMRERAESHEPLICPETGIQTEITQ